MDSLCHLLCTNRFKSSNVSIPSPFNQNEIIDLSIQAFGNTENSVYLINGSPYISVNIKLKALIASSEYNFDLIKKENIELIEQYASSYIKNKVLDYLYKTSKDYHSDIVGFGNFLAYDYLTINEFEKINWPYLYSDSFFNVNVNIDVISGYLLVQN